MVLQRLLEWFHTPTPAPAPPALPPSPPPASSPATPTSSTRPPTVSRPNSPCPGPAPCSVGSPFFQQYTRLMAGSCNVQLAGGALGLKCPCDAGSFVFESSNSGTELLCNRCSHPAAVHNDAASSSSSLALQPTSRTYCKKPFMFSTQVAKYDTLLILVAPANSLPSGVTSHSSNAIGMALLLFDISGYRAYSDYIQRNSAPVPS